MLEEIGALILNIAGWMAEHYDEKAHLLINQWDAANDTWSACVYDDRGIPIVGESSYGAPNLLAALDACWQEISTLT